MNKKKRESERLNRRSQSVVCLLARSPETPRTSSSLVHVHMRMCVLRLLRAYHDRKGGMTANPSPTTGSPTKLMLSPMGATVFAAEER
jgi:hypothetical protein